MANPTTIALVDDDAAIRDALRLYLSSQGLATSCFESAEQFMASLNRGDGFDCVVSDVRMPGMSGLELVRHVSAHSIECQVILITGHGDVDMAVAAIKGGAFDFLEKPFDESRLLDAIRTAVESTRNRRKEHADLDAIRAHYNSLSPRQKKVMECAAAGMSNKEIAVLLCISPKTVENHRAWVMERMAAGNLAGLVRQAMRLQIDHR